MSHQQSLSPLPPPMPSNISTNNNLVSKGKVAMPDRNALLTQIRSGKTLKKAVTNDRSSPQINNLKLSKETKNTNNKISSIQNDPLGLGTVFAQGKPKLRPPFKPARSTTETSSINQEDSLLPIDKLSKTASYSSSYNNPQVGKLNVFQLNINDSCQISNNCNRINSPEKIMKPTPPPSSSKPSFNINSKVEILDNTKTIGRSCNTKPIPPPKVLENPSLKFATMHQQLNKIEKTHLGVTSPKLPVRNHSSPDNLNELVKSHISANNALNVSVKRSTSMGSRQQSQIKAPNYRPPPPPPAKTILSSVSSVPPPIPKRSIATLSNSNLTVTNNNSPPPPPPPPLRTTSKNYLIGHDFETRFNINFHKIQEFPLPQYQQTLCKLYISQVEATDLKHEKNIKSEKENIRNVE